MLYTTVNSLEQVLNPVWYYHGVKEFQNVSGWRTRFAMLSKDKNKYYVLNSEKMEVIEKQQALSKLSFKQQNTLTEMAYEFDKALNEYVRI